MGRGGHREIQSLGCDKTGGMQSVISAIHDKKETPTQGLFLSISLSLSFPGYAQDLASGVWWTDG